MGTKFYCDRCGKDCEYYCAGEMKATINHIAQYKQEYSFCKACAESFNSWLAVMKPKSPRKMCQLVDGCTKPAEWFIVDPVPNGGHACYVCDEHLSTQLAILKEHLPDVTFFQVRKVINEIL